MSEQPRIWLSSPHMGGQERDFIEEAFSQNWIAPLGPNVDGFEKELGEYTGAEHVAALSSGTAAIHLALILLGVQRGDEVLVQSFTFCGSSNPILYQGATPVLIDSEDDTYNMDPEVLEEAIKDRIKKGKKPKAVIMVHLYGMPAKIDEITSICEQYEIPLIEDAAEALGSSYKGRKLGSYGAFSILSFNGNKIITTSGGGALLSNDKLAIEKARFLSMQARDDAPHYEHSELGFNYRMSNIVAGVGRGQLRVLDAHVSKRRSINKQYRDLMNKEGITFLTEPNNQFFSNHWLTVIQVDASVLGLDREAIRLELLNHNIESRPTWKPMHLQKLYKDYPFYGRGVSETLFNNGLCLPSGSNMTEEQFGRIDRCIKSILVSV